MTQSDHPDGPGYGQQPQQPGQQAHPASPQEPGSVMPDPMQAGQPFQPPQSPPLAGQQPPVAAHLAPTQAPLGQQMPPQVPQPVTAEPYVEYPPQQQMPPLAPAPVAGMEQAREAQYVKPGQVPHQELAPQQGQVPLDDYQYPQGQSVLPDVPQVAVPPAMAAPAPDLQTGPETAGQVPGLVAQPGEGGYVDPGIMTNDGEQISQRLAQLQSQYDEELTGENPAVQQDPLQAGMQSAPGDAPHVNETFGDFTAPVDEMPVYPPMQAEPPQPQNYQQAPAQPTFQAPPQTFQEPHQAFQEPHQAQPPVSQPLAPSPVAAQQGGGLGASSHPYDQGEPSHMAGPAIAQEEVRGGGMKKLMLGGAFVTALAVGGGAAYTYQFSDGAGGSASGNTPTIKASATPDRILKRKSAGNGNSVNKAIHRRLNGGKSSDLARLAGENSDKLVKNGVNSARVAGARIAAARSGMLPGAGKTENGADRPNAPRRVKTLIVRPDGTIMRPAGSSDAASAALGPGINAATIPKVSGLSRVAGKTKIRRMKTIGESSIARRAGSGAGSSVAKTAVKSQTRPAIRKPKSIVSARLEPAPARPVKPARPAAVSAPVAGDVGTPFVVQVTSRSSQTSALAAFADMQQKYPSLLGVYAPDIQRADLGTKGVWYRLRVGPVGSKTAAADLCSSLKQAGHPGCFVRRK